MLTFQLVGGYSESFGTIFSTPAVAEKGKLDVKIEVATAGGHSSVPPAHTVSFLLQLFFVRSTRGKLSNIASQVMYIYDIGTL